MIRGTLDSGDGGAANNSGVAAGRHGRPKERTAEDRERARESRARHLEVRHRRGREERSCERWMAEIRQVQRVRGKAAESEEHGKRDGGGRVPRACSVGGGRKGGTARARASAQERRVLLDRIAAGEAGVGKVRQHVNPLAPRSKRTALPLSHSLSLSIYLSLSLSLSLSPPLSLSPLILLSHCMLLRRANG